VVPTTWAYWDFLLKTQRLRTTLIERLLPKRGPCAQPPFQAKADVQVGPEAVAFGFPAKIVSDLRFALPGIGAYSGAADVGRVHPIQVPEKDRNPSVRRGRRGEVKLPLPETYPIVKDAGLGAAAQSRGARASYFVASL